jgi:hypothetical protein
LDKQEIIAELRAVAEKLQTTRLSQRQFSRHGQISASTVKRNFGTWNQAIEAAGLDAISPGVSPEIRKQRLSDDELLQEIIRLTQELGKRPTYNEMSAKGHFSIKPYGDRWGSFAKARKAAYARYGFPQAQISQKKDATEPLQTPKAQPVTQLVVPQTHRPDSPRRRKKVQFGEPIGFRGLRFAPINEQGVVYVFGMISRELGFLIESIRTEYPDCEGKRCVDFRKQRWEHVLIEFEYRSSNFREHGHAPEDCDLIVCWIHDWDDCPIEVLELKSRHGSKLQRVRLTLFGAPGRNR